MDLVTWKAKKLKDLHILIIRLFLSHSTFSPYHLYKAQVLESLLLSCWHPLLSPNHIIYLFIYIVLWAQKRRLSNPEKSLPPLFNKKTSCLRFSGHIYIGYTHLLVYHSFKCCDVCLYADIIVYHYNRYIPHSMLYAIRMISFPFFCGLALYLSAFSIMLLYFRVRCCSRGLLCSI